MFRPRGAQLSGTGSHRERQSEKKAASEERLLVHGIVSPLENKRRIWKGIHISFI